jgi:WD40 repeat protein
MKKHPVLGLIIILMLVVLACNANPFASDEPTEEAPIEEQEATREPEPSNTPPPPPTPEPTATATTEPSPTPEPQSADDILDASRQAMSEVETMHMVLDMQLEMGGEGLSMEIPVLFEGDFQSPDSMAGTVSISFLGISMESEFVSVDGVTYMTNIETGEFELSTGDELFGLDQFITPFSSSDSFLETDADSFSDLEFAGEETLNGIQVFRFSGSMDLDEVGGAEDPAEVNLWIGVEDNLIYQMTIEGETTVDETDDAFFGESGGAVTMAITVSLSNFNEPVVIEVPDVVAPIPTVDQFTFNEPIQSVAFSPDGLLIASGGNDWNVHIWDAQDGSELAVLPGHTDWIRSVAFSPDGQWLASGSDDRNVFVWSVADHSGAPQIVSGHEDWVRSVAFSPDSQVLATGSDDSTVRLWNVADFSAPPTILDTIGYVHSVAFGPDGQYLAAGSEFQLFLWDLNNIGASPTILDAHESTIRSVDFSPDGHYIASGGDDNTVRVWDMANLDAPAHTLFGHSDWVRSVAFSPDGSTLATAGDDTVILFWDVSDFNAIPETLVGHDNWILSIAFSPVQPLLVSGGEDGLALLWPLASPGTFIIMGAQ